MQVELNLQDIFSESSPQLAVNVGDETWENWFNRWLENLQPHLPPAPSYEIGLRLTDDAEIQSLNAQYRHQNKPTDVLAFAALETDLPYYAEMQDEPVYLGDIVISVNTAQRQAQQQGHSLVTELAWLASHGLLHLLGWDHPDDESLMQMLKQQVIILETVGIDIDIEY
ncbi:hypothetical protein NIES2109_29490 [Nostoc sp. HK-01]|nr:hypothetical protein NIES2109_29490 [Nostoc sp. HK-01]